MLCAGQETPRGTRGSPYGPALVEGPGSKDLERPLTGGDRRGQRQGRQVTLSGTMLIVAIRRRTPHPVLTVLGRSGTRPVASVMMALITGCPESGIEVFSAWMWRWVVDHLIRRFLCGRPDPFRTVHDLGLVSSGCPGGSGVPEGCSSPWLPAWLPADDSVTPWSSSPSPDLFSGNLAAPCPVPGPSPEPDSCRT